MLSAAFGSKVSAGSVRGSPHPSLGPPPSQRGLSEILGGQGSPGGQKPALWGKVSKPQSEECKSDTPSWLRPQLIFLGSLIALCPIIVKCPKFPPSLSDPAVSTGNSHRQPFILPHLHSSSRGPYLVNHLHDPFCVLSQRLTSMHPSPPFSPSCLFPCHSLLAVGSHLVLPRTSLLQVCCWLLPPPTASLPPPYSGPLETLVLSDYPQVPIHQLDSPTSEPWRGSCTSLEFPSLESGDLFKKPQARSDAPFLCSPWLPVGPHGVPEHFCPYNRDV